MHKDWSTLVNGFGGSSFIGMITIVWGKCWFLGMDGSTKSPACASQSRIWFVSHTSVTAHSLYNPSLRPAIILYYSIYAAWVGGFSGTIHPFKCDPFISLPRSWGDCSRFSLRGFLTSRCCSVASPKPSENVVFPKWNRMVRGIFVSKKQKKKQSNNQPNKQTTFWILGTIRCIRNNIKQHQTTTK